MKSMRTYALFFWLAAAGLPVAQAGAFTVEPVPNTDGIIAYPNRQGSNTNDPMIRYEISGENLIRILPETLMLDYIRLSDGTDISRHADGLPAYVPNPLAYVDYDGTGGSFRVIIHTPLAKENARAPTVSGSITVQVATRFQEYHASHSTWDADIQSIGPFNVSFHRFPESTSGGRGRLGVTFHEPPEDKIYVVLDDMGGKRLEPRSESRSWGWGTESGSALTYFFPLPSMGYVGITIKVFENPEEQTIHFSH